MYITEHKPQISDNALQKCNVLIDLDWPCLIMQMILQIFSETFCDLYIFHEQRE